MVSATVWTVNTILQWTQQYFAGKGLENPRLDAEVLLCDVLGCRRIDLFMRLQEALSPEVLQKYHERVVRRAAWEPLAYIIGRKVFLQWEFKVTPAVLIPRPETELLTEKLVHCLTGKNLTQLGKEAFWRKKAAEAKAAAEQARAVSEERLQRETDPEKLAGWQREVADREAVARQTAERAGLLSAAEISSSAASEEATAYSVAKAGVPAHGEEAGAVKEKKDLTILDIGTGSGAILCSLLLLVPEARGLALDISAEALAVAKENALTLGVGDRSWFLLSDLWSRVPAAAQFDVVVSNPPYIPSGDIARLAPDVRKEPRPALDGGADGMDAYRGIAAGLPRHVKPDGLAAFEVGIGQGRKVADLCAAQGFTVTAVMKDYAGIDRMVFAARPKSGRAAWVESLSS